MLLSLGVAALTVTLANAEDGPSIAISNPTPPIAEGFKMGETRRPDGATVTMDSRSLFLNGKRWAPAMGEFQYSRYPEAEWREELL
jgi:hypothetical protein